MVSHFRQATTHKRDASQTHAKSQPAAGNETGDAISGTRPPSQLAKAPSPVPNPSGFEPFIPSPTLTASGASPVLNFFINTYRTPPFLLPIYLAAAERYAVPWQVLAAINEVESDYGHDLSVSSAGAEGWMQFLPEEWSVYGVDANGAGVRDPYNPADAIFAAARYLQAAGATHDLRGAIYAYNHSSSYVESVLLRARLLRETPRSMIDGLEAIIDGRVPVEGTEGLAATAEWAKVPALGARTLTPTVVGANIAAAPGAPVLAVQYTEVIGIGRSAKLGRFIQLRDAYGDVYTYAGLGRILSRYRLTPLPRATAPAVPANGRTARPARTSLAPLGKGAWVAPGTMLGNVASGSRGAAASSRGARVRFLFEVRPAGAGPIDPRPLLDAWRLLGQTQGHPQRGSQPLFGPNARDGLINEIRLMSKRRLESRLLFDPPLRRTIAALEGIPVHGGHHVGLIAKLAATPLSWGAARPDAVLGSSQWPRLIARISRLPRTHVARGPTGAAVADTPSSPAPTATSPPALSPPAPGDSETTGPAGQAATPGRPPSGGSLPSFNSPLVDANVPGAALLSPTSLQPQAAVTLETEPAGPEYTGESLVTLKLNTTLAAGSIESIVFEIRPDDTATWHEVESTKSPTQPYAFLRPEEEVAQDGAYELRVLVTETTTHTQYESPAIERLIVIGESPVVKLAVPESPLHGVVKLQAAVPHGAEIQPIRFEWSPSGTSTWRPVPALPGGDEPTSCESTATTACFDTAASEVPSGRDDFRVVPAGGEGQSFVSLPVRGRLVDNTPPEVGQVELKPPDSPLSGDVTLEATAEDPTLPNGEPGSGVAAVIFERARADSAAWTRLPGGEVTIASSLGAGTYTHRLHTEILANGRYRLRARSLDAAGNQASSRETEIEVANPVSAPAVSPSITGVVAPAEDVTILGTVSAGSSPRHEAETWAYGITHAPPAATGAGRLQYTADGHQLVLLRYAQKSGWQIADVPRAAGGATPFQLVPANQLNVNAGGGIAVAGAMTPSGEAWMGLVETPREGAKTIGFFHRSPGGPFEYDKSATETAAPQLESGSAQLRLGQDAEGHVYGMMTANTSEYALLKEGAWTRETPLQRPSSVPSGEPIDLRAGAVEGPDEAWGVFSLANPQGRGLVLGHLYNHEWHFPTSGVGLDALDLGGALSGHGNRVEPEALNVEPNGTAVWIGAKFFIENHEAGHVVARYDGATGTVTNSWCTLPVANSCEEPLGSAAVPDAFFATESGPVALSLRQEAVDVYARGRWTSVLAPGHGPEGGDAFTGPDAGWLGGKKALGQWSAQQNSSLLTPWPLPDRSPLTSVALAPGGRAATSESGALAVGLDGATLRYDASTGWQVEPAAPRAHHLNLLGVAFDGPSSAFAVGQFGVILHWDGTSWSEDPQSISLTQSQLNAVAFAANGEGWAVGTNGTILHYDGQRWSIEDPPPTESGENISSVAVAGSEAFAVAGGNLIERRPSGGWADVEESLLPSDPKPAPRQLRLVAGLPDGGVIAAGRSIMLVRNGTGEGFEYAEQPLSGIAVALAPFRDAAGKLRAYVSVAPPVNQLSAEVAGFPPGDGELLRQTESGWQDLSRSQYAGNAIGGDGTVKSDPVLAVASDQTGEHAWMAGGYDGTEDAAHQGTTEVLSARPAGWRTASIWRYDTTGNAQPSGLASAAPSLPVKPGVVSFAFFTSPECKVQCSAVPNAQPDVNLSAAVKQIAAYAAQPGGPAFAMLGGNAVGPLEHEKGAEPAADFAHLPELLAPLGGLPTFAAIGRADQPYETSFSEAFAEAPEPFGTRAPAAGIVPASSGSQTPNGDIHRYYAFDANQNGTTLRVIVLDDAEDRLEAGASTAGQRGWLEEQLSVAQQRGLAALVVAATPLQSLKEGESVSSLLASSGVLAVFTTSERRLDEHRLIPEHPSPGAPQIPEYEGASLGYQKPQNNGVKWYFVSADTKAREVHVAAVPVIESLALKPLEGLSVARSLTLQFEAVARRPPGTLATIAGRTEEPSEPGEPFPGYDNYVEIPAPSCGTRPCVQPSYAFASSDPTIGAFVEPSGPGSPLPKLDGDGHPIPSSTSNLFCAYNAGTTVVSITTGLLSYSLPVTVKPGGFGSPCGTVYRAGVGTVIRVRSAQTQGQVGGAATPPPPSPAPASAFPAALAAIPPVPTPPGVPKPPSPLAPVTIKPAPVEPPIPPTESVGASPAILPAATPPVEPIPPGASGYAQSPSAAERKEKARKQASQSAFSIRPSGASGEEWFYVAVGGASLLALLLGAQVLPSGPQPGPALLVERAAEENRRRRAKPRFRYRSRPRP
ncbi:MAG TPA: lytic murein transglycosylase [Solirubrobacteraceae bacterium]